MKRLSVCVISLLPAIAAAHHSIRAFYDDQNVTQIEGVVTDIRWINPHIKFTVERVNDAGQNEAWVIESGSVNFLERDGIDASPFAEGDRVRVTGYASRHGRPEMVGSHVTLASGDDVVLWPGLFGGGGTLAGLSAQEDSAPEPEVAPTDADADADGIFRVWTVGRESSGRVGNEAPLPLTPAAVAAQAEYDPITDDTALSCIPQGMPGIMDNPFPMEIARAGDDILIKTEEWDVVRTIHMDGGGIPEGAPATPHGYSAGRWENDTLVIETTKIDWPYFDDIGTPMSDAMHVVEQYFLSDDGNRLNMTMTITDPSTFTEPVHLDGAYWDWVPGETIKPYNCVL